MTGYSGQFMKRVFVLYFLLLGMSISVSAVQIKDLYVASVPVESQDTSILSSSFRVALEKVLMKMSGSRASLENRQIQKSLSRASRFVQQYAFVENVSYDANAPIGPANSPYYLKVSFLEKALLTLFAKSNEAIWGRNRPSVIVWAVYEKRGRRKIVSAGERNPIVSEAGKSASQWGLPIFFPVMDMEDENAISASDLWGGFVDPIVFASERYTPDLIAVLRIRKNSNRAWRGHWTLIQGQAAMGEVSAGLDESANSRAGLVGNMMESLSAHIAARYAVSSGPNVTGNVVMNVSGVSTYKQYVALIGYLSGLTPIKNTRVAGVMSDSVSLVLDIQGYIDKLEQHLSLDSVLIPELSSVGEPGDTLSINYRWNASGKSEK